MLPPAAAASTCPAPATPTACFWWVSTSSMHFVLKCYGLWIGSWAIRSLLAVAQWGGGGGVTFGSLGHSLLAVARWRGGGGGCHISQLSAAIFVLGFPVSCRMPMTRICVLTRRGACSAEHAQSIMLCKNQQGAQPYVTAVAQ